MILSLGKVARLPRTWIFFFLRHYFIYSEPPPIHARPFSIKDAEFRRGARISNVKIVQIKASTGIKTSPHKRKRKLADQRVFERRLVSPFIAHNYIATLLYEYSKQYSATRLYMQIYIRGVSLD